MLPAAFPDEPGLNQWFCEKKHWPHVYLRHVLANIADYPINKVGDMLPWNVAGQLRRCLFD